MSEKAWILTTEYNDYRQYGEYFIAWFHSFPTKKELWKVLKEEGESDRSLIPHILEGRGRREPYKQTNENWYHLREITSSNE